MTTGWIKLHRSLQNCDIWTNNEPFDRRSAWIDLLLSANHDDKQITVNGKPVTITRGQRFTSTVKLSERWHWSVNKVRRYLTLLERLKMVTTNRTRHGITVTIVKYGFFQDGVTIDGITNGITDGITNGITDGITETLVNYGDIGNERTTDGITNRTTNRTTNGIQTRSKKKEEKKNIYGEYKHVRLTDREYERLVNDYGETETQAAIKFLDEYKQRKDYKSKDDNLTMRKWVFKAVAEEKGKSPKVHNYDERNIDYAALEKEALGG